ncbi:MAG: helix-turn-helix domain-containing protein [Acidaminococcaceae bacterium]
METLLVTVAEAAKLLKTNPATVYKLIKEKKLVALKLGVMKIRYETLKEFLANEEKIQNEKI